jgi:hypothetical protein
MVSLNFHFTLSRHNDPQELLLNQKQQVRLKLPKTKITPVHNFRLSQARRGQTRLTENTSDDFNTTPNGNIVKLS